jgi:nucleotide-binding universal stress UspA family protein
MDAQATELPLFERILCGVDGTPASLDAVRQAVRLQSEHGNVFLVAAANLARAVHAGMAAPHAAELLQSDAEAALAEAQEIAPSASSKLLDGDPAAVMLKQAETERATLIAVGSHGRRRAAGLLLGTVAARMLRDAPCSVLVAREAGDIEAWPQTVVAGVDGSLESAAAFAVARSLAARFGGSVRAVASTRDQLDREAGRDLAGARGARHARGGRPRDRIRFDRPARRRKPRAARTEGARERERASRTSGALVRACRTYRADVTDAALTRCRVRSRHPPAQRS